MASRDTRTGDYGIDLDQLLMPQVGEAVVVDGRKYRIRRIVKPPYLPAWATLAVAGPAWRARPESSRVTVTRLRWDQVAGVWRVAPAELAVAS